MSYYIDAHNLQPLSFLVLHSIPRFTNQHSVFKSEWCKVMETGEYQIPPAFLPCFMTPGFDYRGGQVQGHMYVLGQLCSLGIHPVPVVSGGCPLASWSLVGTGMFPGLKNQLAD